MPNDDAEARVGIFWLLKERLVIHGTPLSEAEPYGEFRNDPRSHEQYWGDLQRDGIVPPGMEYEEPPRGRVIYNTPNQRFTLLADRCILQNARVVGEILRRLRLPKDTLTQTDSHYRCSRCLSEPGSQS